MIATSFTTVDDWAAQLRGRIYGQFVRSNWCVPLANRIGTDAQAFQSAAVAVSLAWSIDPVTDDATSPLYGVGRGVQLDRIGALVGQKRGAFADDVYRFVLRARILVNRSHGSADELIAVLVTALAGLGTIAYLPGWIAEFTARIEGVTVDAQVAPVLFALLRAAAQGGTYAVLEWQGVDDDHSLLCADESTIAVGAVGCGVHQVCGDENDPTVGGLLAGALGG